jgi:hypothetical protein
MSSGRRWTQRLAAAALLTGVFLVAAPSSQAQVKPTSPQAGEGSNTKSPAGAPADQAAPPAAEPPATITVDGETTPLTTNPEGDAAAPACPSIWSKVPPPEPFPRIGAFFILPSGPGYYSLKDVVKGECREKPPVYPWPPFGLDVYPFYNNNFRYLDDPKNTQFDWVDPIKRIHIGENWLLSIGGEERIRFSDEYDSRLSGKTNIYEPDRSRIYADLWYRDQFRLFAEYAYVEVSNERNLPPSATDINKTDFVNLFADLKLFDLDCHPVYVRGGRQELDYGSQRLISQTDFPNSPRTFDGIKGFWHSDKLDVDAFLTRPVVIDPNDFNSENDKSNFDGVWATYKPMKGQALDMYYLYLDTDTPLTAKPAPGTRGGFDVNTFGSRYAGDYKILVWDFEGMYQFGEHGAQNTSAGAYTTGAGFHFADLPFNPVFWLYYDYASGNRHPGTGDYSTFNQLFPNGHNYFGWTDLVGRQNIDDLNLQAWFYPTKWITTGLQYHILRLDSAKDSLYNAAGAVERTDATGKSGTDVGQVFTGIVNFHVSQHSDVELQYSHFDSGKFIERTGSPLSPDFFFLQYTFRY